MLPRGSSECHQCVFARIRPLSDRNRPYRFRHVRVGDFDESRGDLVTAAFEAGGRQLGSQRRQCGVDRSPVEREWEAVGLHTTQCEVDVGQREFPRPIGDV